MGWGEPIRALNTEQLSSDIQVLVDEIADLNERLEIQRANNLELCDKRAALRGAVAEAYVLLKAVRVTFVPGTEWHDRVLAGLAHLSEVIAAD